MSINIVTNFNKYQIMNQSNLQYPKFLLKDKYKELIKKNIDLQVDIRKILSDNENPLHYNTLYLWIKNNSPRLTDFNLLNIIWSYAIKKEPNLKITQLLTTQKN